MLFVTCRENFVLSCINCLNSVQLKEVFVFFLLSVSESFHSECLWITDPYGAKLEIFQWKFKDALLHSSIL